MMIEVFLLCIWDNDGEPYLWKVIPQKNRSLAQVAHDEFKRIKASIGLLLVNSPYGLEVTDLWRQ